MTRTLVYVVTKLERGGAQLQALTLLRHLDRSRFTPVLITAREGLLMDEARALEGVVVETARYLERPLHPGRDYLALREITALLQRYRPALVHTHSSKAGVLGRLACRAAGIKAVAHTVHGWSFNRWQPAWQRWAYAGLERRCAFAGSALVVVSQHDRETGLRQGIGVPAQYRLVRYGVDAAVLRAGDGSSVRKEWGIAPDAPLVGMIACFKPQKDPCAFVRAAGKVKRRVPNARFVMVGDGVLRPVVRAAAQREGIDGALVLAGWRGDIPAVLAACDAIALSSRWEGMPIAVLEAMAAGKAVVATDTGGIAEVVRSGENGFLVPVGDEGALADRLTRVVTDETLRRALGARAQAAIGEEYSVARMVNDTQALYEALLREGTPRK